MAIVIFGGAGFIGTHLIEFLSREQGEPLVSVDVREPRIRRDGVTYLKHDVRDLSGLHISEPVSRIYNLAAIHQTPGHETAEYYETNIAGAVEVTGFARRYRVHDMIFASSISIYGPSEEPKTEASIPNPQSAYGASKLLAEQIHRSWNAEDAARHLVIVRPAVVFGPGEGGNFTRLAKLLRHGLFIYPGRKDTIKACIYVEDLIDAIEHARSVTEQCVIFNGCYPDRYTISDIVDAFRNRYFPDVRIIIVPLPVMLFAAKLLQIMSWLPIGIHPERVVKLVRSTDITPAWLLSRGFARYRGLDIALAKWSRATDGRFD